MTTTRRPSSRRSRPAPTSSIRSTRRSASPSPTPASRPSAAASPSYEARLTGGESPRLEGSVDVEQHRHRRRAAQGPSALPRVLRRRAVLAAQLRVERGERRRGRQREGARHARDRRPEPRGRGERALRAARRLPRRQRPGRALARDDRSTAATSASTGRPSCPAAATRSTGRSRSRSSWSWSRRASSDAGARDIRQPAPRLAEHRPAAGGRRAAARRGRAGRVRAARRRCRPTTRTSTPRAPPRARVAAAPDAVRELREAILAADAVLIATPEYNHSIPGQLKNALDWASRPAGQSALNGKPAAAIGASKSMFGGVWAQAELRKVLAAMGGRVIEAELGSPPRPRAARRRAAGARARAGRSASTRSSPSWSRAAERLSGRDLVAGLDRVRRPAGRRRRSRRTGRRRRR